MKVADAMTPRESLVTATVPGTREDVLDRLQDNEFSSVPVVKETDDGEEFRGLVSREQLIDQPDEDQLALLVVEVEPVTSADDLAAVAELIREKGQRRVPVVDDGALVGIVTITDVVRAMANGDVDGDSEVGPLAKTAVNCVYQETPITVAERELAYAQEAYGVVLDDEGTSVGMLTEVDLLDVARIVEGEESTGDSIADEDDDWKWEGIKAIGSRYLPTRNVELPAVPVSEVMTDGLVTVSRTKTATEAAQLMISKDIEQIPLMNGDELVGILRDTDLLEAL
ncbi:CBS domain-containing protein [Halorarius litoreus]|uniref:CBS domain-containing protein n=1 Tax=Halorarius litoreus TaxID=2962676 RepID=UPI0020CCB268|nr:CBS domain-containing protein [Halorarius litoreus]